MSALTHIRTVKCGKPFLVAPLRFLGLVVGNIVIYVVKVVNVLTLQLQQKTMPRKTGGP